MGFIPERHFDPSVSEYVDRTDNDPHLLGQDLANLRTINKYFGGLNVVLKAIAPVFAAASKQATLRILDLATGSADHAVAICELARRMGVSVSVVAVDKNPQVLAIASEQTALFTEIRIEQGDILDLPYANGSFDIVTASLIIHHLDRAGAVRLLLEMKRLSRILCIVNDLHRSWPAFVLTWLHAHVSTRNPLSRHDGPLSILRAFRRNELLALAGEAGLPECRVKRHPFCRLALTWGNTDARCE